MPFQSFTKSIKKNFNQILNSTKYGDNERLPLVYLQTYTSKTASYYEFPKEMSDKPFEYYQSFPKLSQEILVTLFASIGVSYVPEVALYELKERTPLKSFERFCMTFGVEDEFINSVLLNEVIGRLKKMDALRIKNPFDSKAIYTALVYVDLKKADALIDEMKDEYHREGALNNLKKKDN